jgi:DNA-binding NtrC family response regulator
MPPDAPRIIIVDDEADTCENLSDIFADLGYAVDVAQDGLAALRLFEQKSYDIALLDLRMPGMNGLELYRRIKQISAGTVAMIVTAYAASDTACSALEAGAWKLIPKPVNIQNLLGLVDEAMSSPLVLVVDDDAELCENLWEILRGRGYRVHLAHNAQLAGEALRKHEFHVIMLDMKLPGQNGVGVLDLIKRINRRARTIVITGYPAEMEVRVEKALAAGAKAVCYKPFDVDLLLATVKRLAEERKD